MERVIAAPVLRAARPSFLTLTPVCVLIGIGVAVNAHVAISISDCALMMVGALFAHISVNLLNEYDDFRSGLDAITARTPFSGGSGALPEHPDAAATTRALGLASLTLVAILGVYFVYQKGPGLLPLGLLGVLLVVAYTPWVTRRPLLCLFAPGLGFGPVMVMGSAFVLLGYYSWAALVASIPPLLLVSELLLINQFPDIDADRKVGRRHLPIILGRRRSSVLFGAMVIGSYTAIGLGVASGILPTLTLLGLLTLPAGALLLRRVYVNAENTAALIPYMGLNVILIHVTLLLLAIGLLLG